MDTIDDAICHGIHCLLALVNRTASTIETHFSSSGFCGSTVLTPFGTDKAANATVYADCSTVVPFGTYWRSSDSCTHEK